MVDDDLEEGEIEGLVYENLQAQVCELLRHSNGDIQGKLHSQCRSKTISLSSMQVQVSQPGPLPTSHKKKSKKQKLRKHANGSGNAFYDVYGREVR